jgi:hypothetical protein
VITAVPTERAVTNPVLETVATPILFDVQGLDVAGVPDAVSWLVAFTHIVVSPEIVGKGLTVTVMF